MNYRADIDGLRAVAVLAVIFFHLGLTQFFQSGYTGVDIFFIISGYLITTIIYKQSLEKTFSFLDFYERRLRRIFPVFLLVVFVALTLGFFRLYTDAIDDLTNSTFSILLMCANFFFWGDNGYFALESHFKPLLHTWSLSIEEQFYIFFPILMLYYAKKGTTLSTAPLIQNFIPKKLLCSQEEYKNNIFAWLTFFTLISFIACVICSFIDTNTAFYFPIFRAWELLLGSLLAVYTINSDSSLTSKLFTKKWQIQILSLLSLALLFFSITFLESISKVFPGYIALIPCIASVLCIELGKNKESLVYKFLSLKIMVAIGKISYSLYLWHWIVIVFLRTFNANQDMHLSSKVQTTIFVLTFVLSIATYFLIEQPVRRKKIFKTRKSLFISITFITALLAFYALAIKEQYFPRFITEKQAYYESFAELDELIKPREAIENVSLSRFGDPNIEPTLMLAGDSHALMLLNAIDELAKAHNVSGIYMHFPFNISTQNNQGIQIKEYEKIQNYLKTKNIKSVLLASRWTFRLHGLAYVYFNHSEPKFHQEYVFYYENPEGKVIKDSRKALQESIKDMKTFFKDKNTEFFYLSPVPEFKDFIALEAARLTRLNYPDKEIYQKIKIPKKEFLEYNAQVYKDFPFLQEGKNTINLADIMCDENYCYGLSKDFIPLYYDEDHVAIERSEELKALFLPFILSGK